MINQLTHLTNVLHHSISHLTILYLTISILFLNCKDEPTKPPVDDNKPDTTSQNFTITTWEYGDGYASAFANDVWIFDENNIWVVGLFPDAEGVYDRNIMRWNGTQWKPKGDLYNSSGMYAITALDSSNIYFAVGAVIQYKNGTFIKHNLGYLGFSNGQSVDKIWASSENNVWGVGANGCIVHYDGTSWKKINYDTQFSFLDITGSKSTGIAYATGRNLQWNTIIIKLQDSSATLLFQGGDINHPQSIEYFTLDNENEILVSGRTIRKFNLQTLKMDTAYHPSLYMGPISFVASNDIGYFGGYQGNYILVHYNGMRYTELPLYTGDVFLTRGASGIHSIMTCVGEKNNKAFIVFLRR